MAKLLITETGNIYRLDPDGTVENLGLPAGVSSIVGRSPVKARYRGRTIMTGPWSRPVIFTEDYKVWGTGVMPPTTAPTIATTGVGTVNSAAVIGYFTFREEMPNGIVVAESNPGPVSNVISAANVNIAWSAIPTSSPDPRVTHVCLYRADGGALPKLVGTVPIGSASTLTDVVSTATLAAREALPNNQGSLTYERGMPPYARFVEIYHDRAYYGGGSVNPERLYFSKLFEPEAVGANNFIRTRDGEPITGLKRVGDRLLVFCRRSCYEVQGYTASDLQMVKISPSVGTISGLSVVNINDRLWFCGEQGIYIYDGSFRLVSESISPDWRTRILANPSTFDKAVGEDDAEFHCYKLLIPYSSGAYYYRASYKGFDPSTGRLDQIEPKWSIDTRTRYDRSQGRMLSAGTGQMQLFTGSNDGILRRENVFTDSADNSDSSGKAVEIRTKHFFFEDAGGSFDEGKTLKRCWSYVKSEDSAWVFKPLGGDEEVNSGTTFVWTDSVAASSSAGKVAKTRHVHPVAEKVVGHGFTFVYTATGAINWSFRGLGGIFGPGPSYRGAS